MLCDFLCASTAHHSKVTNNSSSYEGNQRSSECNGSVGGVILCVDSVGYGASPAPSTST